jgi:hypothetical protein
MAMEHPIPDPLREWARAQGLDTKRWVPAHHARWGVSRSPHGKGWQVGDQRLDRVPTSDPDYEYFVGYLDGPIRDEVYWLDVPKD